MVSVVLNKIRAIPVYRYTLEGVYPPNDVPPYPHPPPGGPGLV
jgi:hypothetical protein